MLAFGDLDDDKDKRGEIGLLVKEVMERYGFGVEWTGDPDRRLNIPRIDWKRRGQHSPCDPSSST
jgi:hypothetical protein